MDKISKNKRLIVIALLAFLLVVIGATYAYFVAQKGTGGGAQIEVGAGTTDSLTFTKGEAITISANSDNFKSGEPNRKGETEVAAHLLANNGNNTATETYNVYLNLIQNPFVYTKEGNPELILQVINPDGKPLENLEDKTIKYVSVEDVEGDENPLKGFDITTATGLIPIKLNESIEANPSEDDATNGKADEEWQIKIILINHNYDQQVNTGKTFNAQAIITHETLPNIKVETANITNNSMKVIATISDYEDTIDKVEFKINTDEDKDWHEATDNNLNVYSYTFDNLTESKKYEVSTKISFNEEEIVKVIEESITPKKTLADACPKGGNLAECVISLYTKNSKYEDTKLYYHDNNLIDGANDLSYRYAGGDYQLTQRAKDAQYNTINDIIKLSCNGSDSSICNNHCATGAKYTLSYNPNIENLTTLKQALTRAITDGYVSDNNIKNFVCFGGDCSDKENLYRIIGVFKVDGEYKIKLVKADEADRISLGEDGDFASQKALAAYNTYLGNHNDWPRYYWNNSTKINTWSESELNTVNLNTFYLGKLGEWVNMIDGTQWQVGGTTNQLIREQGAHVAYENELGTLKNSLTYPAKIGLMYITDYYYSAPKDRWNLPGYVADGNDYRKAVWDNWLWIGDNEWLITPKTDESTNAYYIITFGYITSRITTGHDLAARPSFYLTPDVMYIQGEGTSDDPIILG